MSRTLAQTRQMITVAMGEQLSTIELDAAINEAISAIQDTLFTTLAPITGSTVNGTYEYTLGTAIVVIIGVDMDGEPVPPYGWDIIEGSTPDLRFSQGYFPSFATTPTYRAHGFGFQAFVTSPSDTIGVDIDYIVSQAASVLHGSRIGQVREELESQPLVGQHEQLQAKFSGLAQVALQRSAAAQAIPPNARRVRSNMMA